MGVEVLVKEKVMVPSACSVMFWRMALGDKARVVTPSVPGKGVSSRWAPIVLFVRGDSPLAESKV